MVAKAKPKAKNNAATVRTPRVIRFGSDFCGMDSSSVAMTRLFSGDPDKWVFTFASDKLKEAKALCHARDVSPQIWYPDVLGRSDPPYVDIYVWSPPCQPFSKAGHLAGLSDDRGKLLSVGAKYIHKARPRAAILENVPNLASNKFKGVVKGLKKAAAADGYLTYSRILDSSEFAVPQKRSRFFLVYIREDCCRTPFQ